MNAKNRNISTVILTLNEEHNIARCIKSLEWCSDIVVLDSGSKDYTVEMAISLGARVYTNVQKPPFQISEQRQWAIENTGISAPWILFLDADEVIPNALATELESLCTEDQTEFNAIELTPRYLFWGKWLKRTQGYPNWHPRVVRRGAVRFVGGVWEEFDETAIIRRVKNPYDHYANSKGLSDWLARHDRYSSWDAQKIVDFRASNRVADLGTRRKQSLRWLAAKFWPLRPWARFIHMFIFRFGFTEGFVGFVFCLLYFFYEWMTVIKVVEIRRKERGQPL